MDYRMLGGSGCAVSSLCLGTMTFGVETDESVAHQQLDRFIEAGGTMVDTADVYGGGRSEEIIGRWFASRSSDVTERVVLATKGRFAVDDSPNGAGLSARHLTRALDASLRRLGLEAVDLYQVHSYDPLTPLEETLRTIEGFIRVGKIRYWGLSNFTGWQLTKAVHLARALNVAGPVTLQPQYSLLAREIEWEIVPAATDAGLGLLPWSPLGGGWLSGKYRRDQRPAGATRLGEDPDRGMEAYDRRGSRAEKFPERTRPAPCPQTDGGWVADGNRADALLSQPEQVIAVQVVELVADVDPGGTWTCWSTPTIRARGGN
jgi:aryl-alcohol dehydrogenase-like predicted oxidoreductase